MQEAGGKVAGVVSERDLFSLQRLSVRELASSIRRAADVEALVQCAADIRALSHALVAQGVAAGHLTRMISSLNDQLAVRILELAAPGFDLSGVALCWLGMGSEGRSEQTIATDQDNGLIFATDAEDVAPDAVRERLLPFARAVNDAMDRCGYPLCMGASGVRPALVREPLGMEDGIRKLDRSRRSGQSPRGEHLLRLPCVVGRRRDSPTRCAPK